MSDHNDKIRVAALADLHVHKAHRGELRPLFAEISERADVLCMCGDLTNLGLPEEAQNLANDLAGLRIPAVAVLGNHDLQSGRGDEVRQVLTKANVAFLDEEPFEFRGLGFAGVKGFAGGFGNHMLGSFGEEAIKHFVKVAVDESLALENVLRKLGTERAVVVLHYSPVIDTVRGEPPEIFPFLGCSRLGETIDRFPVEAVFHGHAHHGAHQGRTTKGIPVFNCSMDLLKRTQEKPYVVVEVDGTRLQSEKAAEAGPT